MNRMRIGSGIGLLSVLAVVSGVPGCQTFREIAALENVDFVLQGVTDVELAGVRLDGVRSYEDLAPAQVLQLLAAVAQNRMPLRARVNVLAENPRTNAVTARMLQLDWSLLLEGKETVSGSIADPVSLPPGQPQIIPIDASLDLLRFFNESGQDLVELVLALAGEPGGRGKEISLRATPTIETPLGRMSYPGPITILRQEVGH